MAVPLIYGGIMLGKFLIPTIARYIIKNGAKKAIKKYGAKVVKNAKVVKQVKQLKQAKPPKGGPKAKVKPKGKPKPVVKAKPKVTPKSKPKKIVSRSKPKPTVKAKPKVTPKSKPKKIVSRTKPKPVTKPVKSKPKVRPKSKPKPVTPKPKPKPIVKGKLTKALPAIVGGGLLLGGLVASMKGKGKDKNIKIERKDKPKPDPKKSIGGTGRGEGALEFARRAKDAAIAKMKAKQSLQDRKLYDNRVDTFESRVRAMVKKKDQLKNIDAKDGSGRNQYQVEMNKLKKERPKEFKKLFTLGGLGKLKD